MTKSSDSSHTVSRLTAHLVWVTKYRYHILKGDIQVRCRELLIQICDSEDVKILSGVVSKEHVHRHIEYAPKKSISDIIKRLTGRTSRMLQSEFPELQKRYWENTFGQSVTEFGQPAISRMQWCRHTWSITAIRQIGTPTTSFSNSR